MIIKICQGKSEDFKDILNFVLTIFVELAIVSQKMENKSFYFKWNGFKGFRKKYILELKNNPIKFELSESIEHRVQIYTRLILLNLFEKQNKEITGETVDELIKQCGIDNQQRNIDKIHLILKFLNLISKDSSKKLFF